MSKKLLLSIGILSAVTFAACTQPDPTIITSTQHANEKPKATNSHSAMNHNGSVRSDAHDNSVKHEGTDHAGMDHSAMQSAPNAAAQPFDLQFLDTMIAHHEGAVEMAKAAETKTQNAELKSFAAKIVADQTRENSEMKRWREQWFAGKPSALNMEMAGMANSMKGMDMAKMNAASGNSFNVEFINQMTPHHEGAIVMAREALTKAEHAELKTLANQIVQSQEAEIKQMQNWKAQWTK
ncbi:MAG: DUF305 domain-containing protein [Acidobacteriota bacterium]|nr:DUF305 domain-containing protein [Acidobacteriota bacterium]